MERLPPTDPADLQALRAVGWIDSDTVVAGHLFDRTGSYDTAFIVAASCGVLAGGAGWIARSLRLRTASSAR